MSFINRLLPDRLAHKLEGDTDNFEEFTRHLDYRANAAYYTAGVAVQERGGYGENTMVPSSVTLNPLGYPGDMSDYNGLN